MPNGVYGYIAFGQLELLTAKGLTTTRGLLE
jgi:hypothetical protein